MEEKQMFDGTEHYENTPTTEAVAPEEDVSSTQPPTMLVPIDTTVEGLAVSKTRALEIIQAQYEILTRLRRAAIALTNPEDWLLFRDREGKVTAYLQDRGAAKIRHLFGISISNVSPPERISGDSDGDFAYVIRGDGTCAKTGQTIQGVEGYADATGAVAKQVTGTRREYYVRKHARANLDGSITRKLTGMESVPLSELEEVWANLGKNIDMCPRGKGFGSAKERASGGDSPQCPKCGGPMKYIPAGFKQDGTPRDAFWACVKGRDKCGGFLWAKKTGEGHDNG